MNGNTQILCVALWSLDDYWYYALFTLVMLVLFEAMLCLQRQKNLDMLRSMRRESTLVYALRSGRWQRVSSEAVTPGEVISLVARPPTVASAVREMQRRAMWNQHHQERPGRVALQQGLGFPMGMRGGGGGPSGTQMGMDQMMSAGSAGGGGGMGELVGDGEAMAPFDVLLMRGSCVVNEAMLTGESVPQAKTSLLSAGGGAGGEDAWVKVEDGTDSPHRKHVIFSGTKVRLSFFFFFVNTLRIVDRTALCLQARQRFLSSDSFEQAHERVLPTSLRVSSMSVPRATFPPAPTSAGQYDAVWEGGGSRTRCWSGTVFPKFANPYFFRTAGTFGASRYCP